MSFLAQCPFCDSRVSVPDSAAGTNQKCPSCLGYFTPLPVTEPAEVTVPDAPANDRPDPTPPPRPRPLWPPDRHAEPADVLVLTAPDAEDAPELPEWVRPAGSIALLLGAAALIGAFSPRLHFLAAPLSGLGLLLGLVALVTARRVRTPCFTPAAGAGLSGLVLLLVTVPALAAAVYRLRHPAAAPALAAIRVVPLSGDALDPDLTQAEWVDASRAALQQHNVGVQVVSATLGPLPAADAARKVKAAAEKCLIIRLRAQQVYGGDQTVGEGKAEVSPLNRRPQVTLRDETGRVYRQVSAEPASPRVSSASGVPATEDVFVFEAPPPGVKSLRLEVPAAAWGGAGAFRFAIPSSMIRHGSARNGRAGPKSGS